MSWLMAGRAAGQGTVALGAGGMCKPTLSPAIYQGDCPSYYLLHSPNEFLVYY
jgi:hypothetical protein